MWLLLGWLFLGIGVIGAFVPVMPTVPFLLVAAFCFERGSPKLHRWLMSHPRLGPPLQDWRNRRVIRPMAKLLAVTAMATSCSYVQFFTETPEPLRWTMFSVMALVAAFILTRKSS